MNDFITKPETQSAFVAIIGRPNVGKSTLLNCLLGKKLSITADKPQTTRHRILGVKTTGHNQVVYVDTPGVHIDEVRALNVEMNKAAKGALLDVDLVLFVVEGLQWTEEDELALKSLTQVASPVFLIINKVDKIKDKKVLLPYLGNIQHKRDFTAIFPISAEKGIQVPDLEKSIAQYLKPGPHYFPSDQVTDKSLRFLVAERIREKLTRFLGQELPYSTTVEITDWKETETHYRLSAVIWVERAGQKAIVIGKKGEGLKKMGTLARQDIEQLLSKSVYLDLWVKVKSGWSDDVRALSSLGYLDPKE